MAVAAVAAVAAAPAAAGAQAVSPPPYVLTLGDAARLAARQSANAVAAVYRAAEYAARARDARSALLPSVNATWSETRMTFNIAAFGLPLPGFNPNGQVTPAVRVVDVRGRVRVPLLDPASLGRYRSAQAEVTEATADADAVAEQAAGYAASAYLQVMRTEAELSARALDSTLARELLGIAQKQLQAGVGVALDVTRARAQLASLRAQLIAARSQRDRARLELLRALDLPLSVPLVLIDSLRGPSPDARVDEAVAIADARRTRADLRAATAAVQSARRAVTAARAERLPTLGLAGDDGLNGIAYRHLLPTYTVSAQVSVPVFSGFGIRARVQEQQAVLRQAETRQRDLDAQVEADVLMALVDLGAAREQVEASREQLRLAEQELDQAGARFRAGVTGNADVITAQLGLDTARRRYIDALVSAQSGLVSLARAQGRVRGLP